MAIGSAIAVGGGLVTAGVAALFGRKRRLKRLADISTVSKLIAHWAPLFGISPEIPMVITGIESDYIPSTENHSDRAEPHGGAWGLMQILLSTAMDEILKIRAQLPKLDHSVAVALSKWDGTGKSLLDPFLNTMLGTWYLAGLAKEFNNDFELVTAAYQQGPAHIKEALARGQSKEEILNHVIGDHGRQYVVMAQARRELLKQQNMV